MFFLTGNILVVLSSLRMRKVKLSFQSFQWEKWIPGNLQGFWAPKYPDPSIARAILRTYRPLG